MVTKTFKMEIKPVYFLGFWGRKFLRDLEPKQRRQLSVMGVKPHGHKIHKAQPPAISSRLQPGPVEACSQVSWGWTFLRKTAMFMVYEFPSLKYCLLRDKMTQVYEYI